MPECGSQPLGERPVVVGSGPAGAFAAYFLAERGYRPIVLERGKKVRERIADMRAFDAGGPLMTRKAITCLEREAPARSATAN